MGRMIGSVSLNPWDDISPKKHRQHQTQSHQRPPSFSKSPLCLHHTPAYRTWSGRSEDNRKFRGRRTTAPVGRSLVTSSQNMQSSSVPGEWTQLEVEAAVSDYFDMLREELRGANYNKSAHNSLLRQLIPNRTKGSVERKHQNISAVLIELGYPYISGYKPLGNYQDLLRRVVEERLTLAAQAGLDTLVETCVTQAFTQPSLPGDLLAIEVPPPVREEQTFTIGEATSSHRSSPSRRRNYLEMEARNSSLGLAGEELILRFEHERLWRAGERRLADSIEHVSRTQGDHTGYDILSYETNGRERLIEVKTTTFGASTPFFVSANQVTTSAAHADAFHLYRLFGFNRSPKLFTLPGSLTRTCELRASEFEARVG